MTKQQQIDSIVNDFINSCTVKLDYEDYCNYILENSPNDRISFYPPCEMALINLSLDYSISNDLVKTISERKNFAANILVKRLNGIK